MAIIIQNQSECPICHTILFDHQNIVMFPAFIPNVKDSMYLFNDAGIHYSCLEKHPLGTKALKFVEKVIFKTRPKNRICDISGNTIDLPENHLFTNLLTSNEKDELYSFNFMNIDIRNISKWKDKQNFIDAIERFEKEEKWETIGPFNYLEYVLKKLKSHP
ncbi:hypothetical protein [Chryseobacterium herbae]|uniref:Uncharacterized protein n=1 Tax=Chryseobacterium herbae TaxID=2976476 RepID=A0ABT2IP66_9FLAO|nr:hypothetical protein [Chryseobacterium sp. pc1-10]MCT2560617.1 hypothetical protein [Chryseobacterium sp. pc1-10]